MSGFAGMHGWVLWVFDYGQYVGCGVEGVEDQACVFLWRDEYRGCVGVFGRYHGEFEMDGWVYESGLCYLIPQYRNEDDFSIFQ